MKKICFFTGSRSEYHLFKKLIKKFLNSKNFKTQLIVSGSHLSKRFGNTISDIIADKIRPSILIKTNEKFNSTFDILNESYDLKNHVKYLKEKIKDEKSICSLIMDQKLEWLMV